MALPLIEGGDPAAIDEFAQTPEEIGYQDLSAPDHVLGVNGASPRIGATVHLGRRSESADPGTARIVRS